MPRFLLPHSISSLSSARIEQCWALADSNDIVTLPCETFRKRAEVVILASSLKTARWKEWLKHSAGKLIYSELPTMLEIGAML